MSLGDLTKLLEQGYLKGDYTYQSDDGEYKFELKTVNPLDELAAYRDVDLYENNKDVNSRAVYVAIELLSRSIQKVNGTDLDKVTGATGESSLDKKRSVVRQFGEKLLLGLWSEYQKLKIKTAMTGTKEEEEEIKKS